MSWVRRLLLLAGLVFGSWLLGSLASAAEASADIRIDIDLPLVGISVELDTTPVTPLPPVEQPLPAQPRTEVPPPPPPVEPVPVVPSAEPVDVFSAAPVAAEPPVPQPVEVPAKPVERQRVDLPVPGSPPTSGAGQSTTNTPLVGTLTFAASEARRAVALVRSADLDVPPFTYAEDPSFSPD